MRLLTTVAVAIVLSGCVAFQKHPNTRPMTPQTMQTIARAEVVVAQNNNGVEKSWFYTDASAGTAAYGLIGALAGAIANAIINVGPARRANHAANEIGELVPAESLTSSLVAHLQSQVPAADATPAGVSLGSMSSVQKITSPGIQDGKLEITTSYMLAEDSSAFRVIARVTLESKSLPYKTPYTFEKSVPKSELVGPVYRNTFTYHSEQLPVPTLSPEIKERLVANIEGSYKDASGALPAADSDEGKKMEKELEQARDEKLTKDEIAIFLTREWVKDNAAMLKREVENAHAFIARYLLQDLNSTTVPAFEGQDQLLDTSNGRTVRRIGAGLESGSYVSAPGDATSFTTYGNATAIAKVHQEKISALNKQAAAAKQAQKKKKAA
jgi:hypothetical protein